MLGAATVLEERGLVQQILMISRNGSPAAVEKVRQGISDGTWDLDAPGIGSSLGSVMVRHLAGQRSVDHLSLSPVGRMISRENVDTWRPWEQRVNYQPFSYGLD